MRSTRWLPALILAVAVACAPATAALARPAPSAPAGTGWRCNTSNPQGNCGPYAFRPITKSNGYNTYVSNNKWGCGNPDQCGRQTVHANTPGDWQVTSNQAAGNTAVLTYPDVQQVFTSPRIPIRLSPASTPFSPTSPRPCTPPGGRSPRPGRHLDELQQRHHDLGG